MATSAEKFITDLLFKADIRINGDRAWDIQVNNSDVFERIITQGSLGFGEAYMEGWFDCERLDLMIDRAYKAELPSKIDKKDAFFAAIKAHAKSLVLLARQSR